MSSFSEILRVRHLPNIPNNHFQGIVFVKYVSEGTVFLKACCLCDEHLRILFEPVLELATGSFDQCYWSCVGLIHLWENGFIPGPMGRKARRVELWLINKRNIVE